LSTYTVPYSFIGGTKASADEVNKNFSYITEILDSMNAAQYPFCVNSANRSRNNVEDLFAYSGSIVTSKVGGIYDEARITTGSGTSLTVTDSAKTTVTPTTYKSIVPVLKSSKQDDINCATTSEASGYEAWHAFDKDENTYWGSFVGVNSADLAITFSQRYNVSQYYVKTLTAASWTLEGSNDQSVWTELDSYSVEEASGILRSVSVSGNYNVFRLSVTVSGSNYQIRIAEFDLYEEDSTGSLRKDETQILYLGAKELRSYANKFFVQEAQPAGIQAYDSLIPEMKSNVVPAGYTISASSYTAQNPPYAATDNNIGTTWEATSTSDKYTWFQVQLPNRATAKVCKLTLGSEASAVNKAIRNGRLLGSNNAVTWVTLYDIEDLEWTSVGESKYLYFTDNDTQYSYYRLEGKAPFASLAEFQLYEYSASGEYMLGEASLDDVWFSTVDPHEASIYVGSSAWAPFDLVPAGEVDIDSTGAITEVRTYPYDQNGFNVNAFTTKDFAGNVVTYDSFQSLYGETGCVQLPNKFLLQWGRTYGGNTTLFPVTFPNSIFGVFVSPIATSGAVGSTVTSVSTSGFTAVNAVQSATSQMTIQSNVQNYWFAIGR
jgi:hypothetical protein